jgi:hypothetical protein
MIAAMVKVSISSPSLPNKQKLIIAHERKKYKDFLSVHVGLLLGTFQPSPKWYIQKEPN